MAIYHCSVKTGSRATGRSAVAAAAYRSGAKLIDKQTGEVSDYTRKGGVVYSEVSLCENAPIAYSDRQILWNAVQEIEKASNARLFREIEVALPRELRRAEQIRLMQEYVKHFTDKGMCADWAIHDKRDGNPHAHIMLTVRSIDEDGKWTPKSRKVYDLDENGQRIFQKIDKTGRKQYKCHKEDYNDWNATERVPEWRELWAKCCNARLDERNRIDHRSYKAQGIGRIPYIHEGHVARSMALKGKGSERVAHNLLVYEFNQELKDFSDMCGKLSRLSREIAIQGDEQQEQKFVFKNLKSGVPCSFTYNPKADTITFSQGEKSQTVKMAEYKLKRISSERCVISPFNLKFKGSLAKAAIEYDEFIRKLQIKEQNRKRLSSRAKPDEPMIIYKAPERSEIVVTSDVIVPKPKPKPQPQQPPRAVPKAAAVTKDPEPSKDQPLFSKAKVMSDEYKPRSEQQEQPPISRPRHRGR